MATTFYEILKKQREQAQAQGTGATPNLTAGKHVFTIIAGVSGASQDGRGWSALDVRHTNGYQYRIFYNLFWPLKEGEVEQQLNIDTFNWIEAFDPQALVNYAEDNFDAYFNSLKGKQYEITYMPSRDGQKVFVDFKTPPLLLDILEEDILVEEINFDDLE